jgi:hypothetical protein
MQKNKKYNIKSILVQNQRLSFKDKLFFQELEGFIRPLRMTQKIKKALTPPKTKKFEKERSDRKDIELRNYKFITLYMCIDL